MATSKDFEKLWRRYQDEFQSSGKSIVTYCQENGIVYSQFERWYKKRVSSQDKQPVLVRLMAKKGLDAYVSSTTMLFLLTTNYTN